MQALESLHQLLERLNAERADLLTPITLEGDDGLLGRELQAFIDRVQAVLKTLEEAITQMGGKEALSVLQVRRLTEILDAQGQDVQRMGQGVEELAQGVTRVAEDTHQAAEVAANMREVGDRNLAVMEQVLKGVAELEQQARATNESVSQLVSQTAAAAEGLKAIRGVAATSQLLALNAAIQAAHANDRAFAVVAGEMRRLADRTDQLGRQIEGQVSAMEAAIASASAAMKNMAEMAARTELQAREASGGLKQVEDLLAQVSEAVQSIAAVAEEEAAATEEMAATAQDLNARVQAAAESINLTRNIAISEMTEEAQAALGRFYIGSRADRVRDLLEEACAEVEAAVERMIAEGRVYYDDLWDFNYREIKGADIASLAHLFRVDKVPKEGFKPPKYRTNYDQKIDLPLMDIMDRYIDKGGLFFLCMFDLNSFTFVHGRNMTQDWTNVWEQDIVTNRVKRLFLHDRSVLRGARVGAPPHIVQKDKLTAADVDAIPGPGSGPRPFLLQTYALDTGEVVMAMAMPLYIRGRRWAALRAGYMPRIGR